jgi:diacylglycerol kinase
MIIGAGISFLQNTDKGKDDAKNLASGAVIGFLVMFSAYWIVQIVQYITKTKIPI